mmetsp:Transcript_31177/g.66962  ORF Transcript_31177/g.66962 Transcript_31177/m.66962 type:complete len:393 (-) Transcript_31177:276-1454(-)
MSKGGDDGSSAGEALDVIIYLFVLGPAVEWCLKSQTVNKKQPGSKRGIMLAVCLLAAVAAVKLAWELSVWEPNHFRTIGVHVTASTAEIKKAYRSNSFPYHPDKAAGDPKASAIFMKMTAAYEVLKDPTSRDLYNKFGARGLEDAGSNSINMALFYVIWLVVGYLLTMGKASEDARTWAFSGLLALAVFEYQTRILSADYLSPIFPQSTVNEKLEILHKLFPPFLHGSRMISQVIFRDVGLFNKLMLEQMHLKVDELGRQVLSTRKEIEGRDAKPSSTKALGNEGGAAGAGSGASGVDCAAGGQGAATAVEAAEAAKAEWEASLTAASATAGPTGGGAAAGAAAEQGETEASAADAAARAAAQAQAQQSRMMNIVMFFVAYAVFKYLVDNEW